MVTETESKIESIDIANDDLIEVLAMVAEYHRTRGAATNPRLAVVGDGPRKMLMPTATSNFAEQSVGDSTDERSESDVVEDTIVRGSQLVSDGEINDEIEVDGQEVEVNVL